MARRLKKVEKRASSKATVGRSASVAHAEAEIAVREIPLDLKPLVAPYKGQGRLSLRIERLPNLARLSAGQNNGDHSWSLGLDEIEDLIYFAPEGSDDAHTLGVRIIAKTEGDASTLAVVDLPVPEDETDEESADLPEVAAANESNGSGGTVTRLRANGTASVPISIVETIKARQANESQEESEMRARIETELATARSRWQIEFEQRLTQAEERATAELKRSREVWRAEREASIAEKEREFSTRLEEALGKARQETKAALADAEKTWRQGEAIRLAAAEASWQANAQQSRADADGKLAAACEAAAEAARNEAKATLAEAEKSWREEESTRLASARSEVKAALEEAEKSWRQEEAARLAAAEAKWRAEAEKFGADAMDELSRAREQGDAIAAQLRAELAGAKTALSDRESALRQLHDSFAKSDENWQKKLSDAIAGAKISWTAEETVRVRQIADNLNEQHRQALADREAQFKADAQSARNAAETELGQLREAMAALQQSLGNRESEFSQLQSFYQRRQDEAKEAVATAKAVWKAEEATRLREMENRLTEQHQRALSESGGSVFTEAKAADQLAEAERTQWLDTVAKLQETIVIRDADLAALRNQSQARPRELEEALSAAKMTWKVEEEARIRELESRLAEQHQRALAELEARAKVSTESRDDASRAEMDKLRASVTELQTALAGRDAELAQLRAPEDSPSPAVEQALSAAKNIWAGEEERRLKAAESRWQEKSAHAIAEVEAKCAALEAALARVDNTQATRSHEDDAYIRDLNREVKELREALVDRETELARAHVYLEDMRRRVEMPQAHSPDPTRAAAEERENSEEQKKSHLARDVLILVAVVSLAVFLLPGNMDMLPANVKWQITRYTGITFPTAHVIQTVEPAAAAPKDSRSVSVVLRTVNMRAEPSTSGDVTTTLRPDTKVTVLETQGNWVHVELSGEGDAPQQGWVYSSFISDAEAPNAKP